MPGRDRPQAGSNTQGTLGLQRGIPGVESCKSIFFGVGRGGEREIG
jgi:hypothetical protein